MNNKLSKVALMLVMLALPLSASNLLAQNENKLRLVGRIQAINAAAKNLTVRGLTVRTDEQTAIYSGNARISFQNLQQGMVIRILGVRRPDAVLKATEIRRAMPGQVLTLQGLIQAKSDNSRTVNVAGMTVYVPSGAKLLSVTNRPIYFGDLRNGAGATLQMVMTADGRLQARQIRLITLAKVSGILEDASRSRFLLRMDEGMIYGDATTRVVGGQGKLTAFKNLIAGQKVTVRVLPQSDSTLFAAAVNITNAQKVRLSGAVQQWNPVNRTFKLRDYLVRWEQQTRVSSRVGTLSAIRISNGQFVKVQGRQLPDFSIRANSVDVSSPNEEVEVEGVLEAINSSSVVVNGVTFQVNASTHIEDAAGNPIGLSNLTVGDQVEVEAVLQADSSLLATEIKVEDEIEEEEEEELEMEGIVESLSSNSITVSGFTFQITAETEVEGQPAVGVVVEIEAVNQGGVWVAVEIKVEDEDDLDEDDEDDEDDDADDDDDDEEDDEDDEEDDDEDEDEDDD